MYQMGISRRDLLKGIGMAGLGAAVWPVASKLPRVGSQALAAASGEQVTRQWTMVIDLKKCEGCETIGKEPQCTAACNKAHFVPQGQDWIKVSKVEGACGGSYWMPFPCMQCQNAPCVKVCPVGASYHTKEGIVLINHERCIGCRLCMAACPYQRRYFNWEEQKVPAEAILAQHSPEYPVPAVKGTVSKCMFCAHNAMNGKLPVCVSGCPMGALYFGDKERDLATNGIEVKALGKMLGENNAFRYKEELGTEPRVYYLPGYGQEFGRESRD